jgi:AraC-like DNA-binding protein
MNWDELTWEIPLERPPEVVNLGRNVHGFDPTDLYCLPDLWSLHLYSYDATLRLGDLELPIRPGYVGLTPPATPMEYRYVGMSVHIYAHFRVPPGPTRTVRAMQDLGAGYDAMYARLLEAVRAAMTEPARVTARVWDVLWDLSRLQSAHTIEAELHPAVRTAVAAIERDLASPISVAELAQEAEVSYGYLSRLFQQAYGDTVVGFVRRRRIERALHLLQRSTLPIKLVAASVGIPDLQHFNKAIRSELGMSPRAVRESYKRSP